MVKASSAPTGYVCFDQTEQSACDSPDQACARPSVFCQTTGWHAVRYDTDSQQAEDERDVEDSLEALKEPPGVRLDELRRELGAKWEEATWIEALEGEVRMLKERCLSLEVHSPLLIPVESLAPEPYAVIKPIPAVVRKEDDEYIASFFDANLAASGDTQAEAIFNLKDIIVAALELFADTDEGHLGPGPLRQKRVLEEFVLERK